MVPLLLLADLEIIFHLQIREASGCSWNCSAAVDQSSMVVHVVLQIIKSYGGRIAGERRSEGHGYWQGERTLIMVSCCNTHSRCAILLQIVKALLARGLRVKAGVRNVDSAREKLGPPSTHEEHLEVSSSYNFSFRFSFPRRSWIEALSYVPSNNSCRVVSLQPDFADTLLLKARKCAARQNAGDQEVEAGYFWGSLWEGST
jgi:hypothetical protein